MSWQDHFLHTTSDWLREEGEILTLFRYANCGGAKDFQLWQNFDALAARIAQLPSLCSVIAFRERQLPIRGIITREFVSRCIREIPDGEEFLVLKTQPGKDYWNRDEYPHSAGESHAELREDLEGWMGCEVAVGFYPPWLYDSEEVISTVVPDENGATKGGWY